mmetsp:Transcript_26139/g.85862  ORF Transcript_26139/g.85862 Transcript_26139/m.85862 type:complete len:431 (+) Transcript_26139:375-1667(+)
MRPQTATASLRQSGCAVRSLASGRSSSSVPGEALPPSFSSHSTLRSYARSSISRAWATTPEMASDPAAERSAQHRSGMGTGGPEPYSRFLPPLSIDISSSSSSSTYALFALAASMKPARVRISTLTGCSAPSIAAVASTAERSALPGPPPARKRLCHVASACSCASSAARISRRAGSRALSSSSSCSSASAPMTRLSRSRKCEQASADARTVPATPATSRLSNSVCMFARSSLAASSSPLLPPPSSLVDDASAPPPTMASTALSSCPRALSSCSGGRSSRVHSTWALASSTMALPPPPLPSRRLRTSSCAAASHALELSSASRRDAARRVQSTSSGSSRRVFASGPAPIKDLTRASDAKASAALWQAVPTISGSESRAASALMKVSSSTAAGSPARAVAFASIYKTTPSPLSSSLTLPLSLSVQRSPPAC